MIRHYCDGCGKEVTMDTGVLRMKEVTLEFPYKKVSIVIEIDCMEGAVPCDHPAVCAECIANKFRQWADSVSNAPVAQRTESLVSTQLVEGSNPSGSTKCQ